MDKKYKLDYLIEQAVINRFDFLKFKNELLKKECFSYGFNFETFLYEFPEILLSNFNFIVALYGYKNIPYSAKCKNHPDIENRVSSHTKFCPICGNKLEKTYKKILIRDEFFFIDIFGRNTKKGIIDFVYNDFKTIKDKEIL